MRHTLFTNELINEQDRNSENEATFPNEEKSFVVFKYHTYDISTLLNDVGDFLIKLSSDGENYIVYYLNFERELKDTTITKNDLEDFIRDTKRKNKVYGLKKQIFPNWANAAAPKNLMLTKEGKLIEIDGLSPWDRENHKIDYQIVFETLNLTEPKDYNTFLPHIGDFLIKLSNKRSYDAPYALKVKIDNKTIIDTDDLDVHFSKNDLEKILQSGVAFVATNGKIQVLNLIRLSYPSSITCLASPNLILREQGKLEVLDFEIFLRKETRYTIIGLLGDGGMEYIGNEKMVTGEVLDQFREEFNSPENLINFENNDREQVNQLTIDNFKLSDSSIAFNKKIRLNISLNQIKELMSVLNEKKIFYQESDNILDKDKIVNCIDLAIEDIKWSFVRKVAYSCMVFSQAKRCINKHNDRLLELGDCPEELLMQIAFYVGESVITLEEIKKIYYAFSKKFFYSMTKILEAEYLFKNFDPYKNFIIEKRSHQLLLKGNKLINIKLLPPHVAYREGLIAYKNAKFTEALSHFKQAAKIKFPAAYLWLGCLYETGGLIGPMNIEECELWYKKVRNRIRWFEKEAEKGSDDAQYNLGWCLEFGIGVKKDLNKAVVYYKRAADQGFAPAQSNLAWCYGEGAGVEKNIDKAILYYQLAADQGYASAQANLGLLYQLGIIRVKKGEKKAFTYYQLAADKGFAPAQANLAWCYQFGKGVEKDLNKAAAYYQLAADQGYAPAQVSLALCYQFGHGVKKDIKQSITYFQLASDQGDSYAQNCLGLFYKKNQYFEEAVRYFELAANQNHREAQHNLAKLTEKKAFQLIRSQSIILTSIFTQPQERTKHAQKQKLLLIDFDVIINIYIRGNIEKLEMIFKTAFDNGYKIGIIAFNNYPHLIRNFLHDILKAVEGITEENKNLILDKGIVSWIPQNPFIAGKNEHIEKCKQKLNFTGKNNNIIVVDDYPGHLERAKELRCQTLLADNRLLYLGKLLDLIKPSPSSHSKPAALPFTPQ